jgi:hypothetical protein
VIEAVRLAAADIDAPQTVWLCGASWVTGANWPEPEGNGCLVKVGILVSFKRSLVLFQ